jgi:PKD repeat protein/type 1 glutamine amidotransferase
VRKATVLVSLLGLIGSSLFVASTAASAPPAEKYRIFVFTSGAPNFARVAAVQAIRDIGMANGFGVQSNGDPASFTAENLARFRAVVFLDTTGSPLNAAQETAFEDYFRAGGGFVGVGSAVDTEPDWQFLTDVLGTRSASKLGAQTVTNKVADRVHDASKNLPEYWNLNDTYYNWTSNVRGLSHVLTTVSDAPFNKTGDGPTINALTGGTMGADHPVTWCKDYQGGRSYYTNHGASAAAWNDANLAKELVGAITWTAGQSDPVYSDCGATVLANYQQSFVAAPPNLSEPIGFDVLPDGTGRVIQTDRRGGVRLHDPATNSTTLLATLPVYTVNEDGGYGPELDNNFNTNKWVYLFYSPPTVKDVKLSTGEVVTQTTPAGAAPNTAASVTAWDPFVGYFQLSRFKFVEASGGTPAHLDLASEQEIMRVSNNRGACCHVGGDIEFDSHNNLWLVTGDDTPSGGGNSGGFSPFNSQLTNENQTITVAGATGGTFALTFDGQTTAPIPFPLVNADIEAALEALSNLDDVAVTGTVARTVNFRGDKSEQGVPQMTADASGLTGTTPTVTIATTQEGGWFFAPHVDARRTAQNTAHLGGKVLRVTVKAGDISASEANTLGGAYTVPEGNLYPVGTARTRPEIYAMGFRNPFRITLDKDDVAYVTDYSPDSQVPQMFRGPQGTGRVEIVRGPANYGWPLCVKSDLPYYKWDFNTSTPLPSAASPEPHECDNPARGPQNTSRWVANGGPGVDPGLEYGPPITQPEIWYSYRDNQAPPNGPQGTPCFAQYGPGAPPNPVGVCPQLFPEAFTGGVGPHGAAPYDYDPANPSTTKFPPYFDGAFILGEFTQDTMREVRLDSQNRIFKINPVLNCGPAPTSATRPFLCDNPMDMEFGPDGNFYLLTYGDGFFAINPDAAMERFEYVKGLRAPVAVLAATPTDGQDPLTVSFSSEGSHDPDPGDSIRFEWDFDGDGTVDSVDPNPTFTYTTRGVFVARLTVTDSSGKVGAANTTITVGNTSPTVTLTIPVDGGTFAFGDNIPFSVTVSDPEDGAINCAEVEVTFVLGHDTHGHAQTTVNGCSGVLPTDPEDVSHGGNVFGVISASYTDHGGAGGVPALTTVDQNQIRQKRQEVEFAVNQSGTNTAATTDVGGGLQRGGLSAGDWIELNGPFNLVNISDITFRTSGGTAGGNAGTVEIWRDAINAAGGGSLVTSVTIAGTANATTYASQTFPISDTGTHRYFLVFQPAAGGPGNNFFNLNWVEFVGAGVGT